MLRQRRTCGSIAAGLLCGLMVVLAPLTAGFTCTIGNIGSKLEDATLSRGATQSGTTWTPVDVTDRFNDTDAMYVTLRVTNAGTNPAIRVDWIAVDLGPNLPRNQTINESNRVLDAQHASYSESLRPRSSWPPGSYRVDIYLFDRLTHIETLAKSLPYTVQ